MVAAQQPFHMALFLPSLAGGGAQRVTLNLAQGLMLAGGIQVDLVLGKAEGPYIDDIPPGVRVIDLKQRRMSCTVLPLIRYLRAAKPNALVSSLHYANVAAVIATFLSGGRTRTAIVNHVHLTSALTRIPLVKKALLLWLMRGTYPHAHATISVSEGVAADLATHVRLPAARTHVIGNPVVDQTLIDKARQPVNHPWLTTCEPSTIVAVGNLIAVKDFPMLLHAFAALRRHSAARLIILGEGPQRGELRQLIAELGLDDAVDMPGFTPNPYGYMARAAAVVLSSRWEALPTVLIEAMACGTPIIATDCPCGPREILEEGKYGRLVAVGDVPAMTDALLDAVQGRLQTPPPASWKRYSIEYATSEYLKVFGVFGDRAPGRGQTPDTIGTPREERL